MNCPYLLIDVRDPSEFEHSHLVTATSYPTIKISRAVGWETEEIFTYKNHPEHIIAVYDEAEDYAPDVCCMLQHRGYENIFMLSGGLKLARDKFGYPLVTDDPSRRLSLDMAEQLAEQVSTTILPPLTLTEAGDWWEQACHYNHPIVPDDNLYNSSSSAMHPPSMRLPEKLNDIEKKKAKPKPWR